MIDRKFTYIFTKIFWNMNIPICIGLLASVQLAYSKIESETVPRNDGINPGINHKSIFHVYCICLECLFLSPIQMCF